jgi:FkbM family methyltransferase
MVKVIGSTDPAEVEDLLWVGFPACETGFDVGANCGQSIPQMLKFCDFVRSYEPNLDAFGELKRHLSGRVSVHAIAVSDHDGTVPLAQLPGKQLETGQLVTPGIRGMEWDPGDWADVPVREYPCRMLDSLADPESMPGFIKVDVEGHEVQVLRGGPAVIAYGASWLIEFHSPAGHDECEAILRDENYHTETVRHPHYVKGSPMYWQHGWLRAFPH